MEWLQAVDGRLSLAQTTPKVIFKLHSHYPHLLGGRVSHSVILERSLPLPLLNLHFVCPVRDPMTIPTEIDQLNNVLPEHYESENITGVSHCPVGCSNLPHKVPGLQRLPFDVV
jgi:hypothetical protein